MHLDFSCNVQAVFVKKPPKDRTKKERNPKETRQNVTLSNWRMKIKYNYNSKYSIDLCWPFGLAYFTVTSEKFL